MQGKLIAVAYTLPSAYILHTIKPCDKGAGIIILQFESYMESCLNQLSNQQLQESGTLNP